MTDLAGPAATWREATRRLTDLVPDVLSGLVFTVRLPVHTSPPRAHILMRMDSASDAEDFRVNISRAGTLGEPGVVIIESIASVDLGPSSMSLEDAVVELDRLRNIGSEVIPSDVDVAVLARALAEGHPVKMPPSYLVDAIDACVLASDYGVYAPVNWGMISHRRGLLVTYRVAGPADYSDLEVLGGLGVSLSLLLRVYPHRASPCPRP